MKEDSREDQNFVEAKTSQTIYSTYLRKINNISFTAREIDIIACIVRGRRASKIATLLSISVKNVENRIGGIKLKLGCNSQEGIIDFIEKADKFELMNQYYSSLLIQVEFEKSLKKISALLPDEKPSCYLVFENKQKTKGSFILALKRYLMLAGIPVFAIEDNDDTLASLKDRFDANQPIVSVSDVEIKTQYNLNAVENSIDLTKQPNNYFLIFEILKKILPNLNLDSILYDFKLQSSSLTESAFQDQVELKQTSQLLNNSGNDSAAYAYSEANTLISKKNWLFSIALAFLGICFVAGLGIVYIKKDPDQKSIRYTLNKASSIEAKEICKVPAPCEFFSGRLEFLDKIKAVLKGNNKVVIVGYQGMGKTQVSYQYAKQNAKAYAGGTYMFKADSEQSLMNSLRSFSIALGITTQEEIYRLNDDQIKKLIIPMLYDYLKDQKKMLFIFDNVDNYEDIKDLVPIHANKHDLILTSSYKKWDAWNWLELHEFDQDKKEAENLILKVLQDKKPEQAKKLAKTLGYYPLAITQAINYLKNNPMISIEHYIKEYESLFERRKTLLNYKSFEQDNYIKTSLTAFEISKKTLDKELAEAYRFLKLCAYFSHDIIPVSVFKKEIKDILHVLEILNKYSLIDITNVNGEFFINMHNIIRDNIKIHLNEINEELQVKEKVIGLLNDYFVYDFWDKKNIEKTRIIFPHIEHFLNYLDKNNSRIMKTSKFIEILSKTGAYYIHCFRDTIEAIRTLEKAKNLAETVNTDATLLNRIMEDLATSYYYQGEYNQAREELQRVQKRNGATELSFLIEGHILYNECRYDESQKAYERVIDFIGRDENSQYLPVTHRSLGLVFYKKSLVFPERFQEYIQYSKKYLKKALEVQERFNSENLELAITKHALGRTAIKLKEFELAFYELSGALRIAQDYCKKEKDNYEILVMKRTFGHYLCLHVKERFGEGVNYLKEALEGKLRLYNYKPHQAIIGTIELIVDVYSHHPKNKDLVELMPTITRYLENWTFYEKLDRSKQINHQLMDEKIFLLKETILKINHEKGTIL